MARDGAQKGEPMDGMSRLDRAARARGLDVLLERPGKRFRLAVQTSRARVRAGAAWHRAFVGLPEITGSRIDHAARLLADDVEQTPADTRE